MDVFSIGCVLAEIFTDSNSLFNYQSLINYKKGDISVLDKLNTIEDEEIKQMILKMLSLDSNKRGTLTDHLNTIRSLISHEIMNLYSYLNYVMRRGEFSHPDVKLGLIRVIAPRFVECIEKGLSNEESVLLENLFKDTKFRRCFPYHISKVSLLSQLKGIVLNCPLNQFFDNNLIVKFIDDSMKLLDVGQVRIGAADSPSSIHLDSVNYLKEVSLNIDQEPFTDKDEFHKDLVKPVAEVRQTMEKIIIEAQKEIDINKTLRRFSPFAHLIEILCSLLRNLQLSQSYQVGLEIIEIFSRFTRSDQIVFIIFPHLLTQLEESENKIEKYYSITLFCTLVHRIKYVSRILAKKNAFSGYVQAFINLCQSDPALKNQIFRNIYSFIYLNIIFNVLGYLNKMIDKLNKGSELSIDKVV